MSVRVIGPPMLVNELVMDMHRIPNRQGAQKVPTRSMCEALLDAPDLPQDRNVLEYVRNIDIPS